jgi:hypothetical protein
MELLRSFWTFREERPRARGKLLSEYRVLSIRVIDITRQGSLPVVVTHCSSLYKHYCLCAVCLHTTSDPHP